MPSGTGHETPLLIEANPGGTGRDLAFLFDLRFVTEVRRALPSCQLLINHPWARVTAGAVAPFRSAPDRVAGPHTRPVRDVAAAIDNTLIQDVRPVTPQDRFRLAPIRPKHQDQPTSRS